MLDKHWDGGFLPVGWHKAEITDVISQEFQTGSKGVDYMLRSETGATGKVRFVLVESILWRLASFLKAVGLTREQAARFDENSLNHHRHWIGKMVQVQVILSGLRGDPPKRYAEVDNWLPMSAPTPVDAPPPEHVAPAEEGRSGNDCPF